MYVSRRSEGYPGGPCRGIGPQRHPPGGGSAGPGAGRGPRWDVVRGETVPLLLVLCLAMPSALPCLAMPCPGRAMPGVCCPCREGVT